MGNVFETIKINSTKLTPSPLRAGVMANETTTKKALRNKAIPHNENESKNKSTHNMVQRECRGVQVPNEKRT